MKERILFHIRNKKFGIAAKLIADLIDEEEFFELRNILSAIYEDELEKILFILNQTDRATILRLLLNPQNDIPPTEDNASEMISVAHTSRSYSESSVWYLFKKRVPWLLILLLSATFTSLIITSFESSLSEISSLLIASVPMLMDTGGNSGSQASVTVIRALALGEIEPRDAPKILFKEIRVALLLGLSLATACFFKLLLIDRLIFGQPFTFMICFTVAFALFITVIIAKAVGCSLPLLVKSLGLDPAVVASPFITTVIDSVALFLYCIISINILS